MPVSINKLRVIAGAVVVALAGGSGYYMQMSRPEGTAPPVPVRTASAAAVADQGPLAPAMPSPAEPPQVTRAAARPVFLVPEAVPELALPAAPPCAPDAPLRAPPRLVP